MKGIPSPSIAWKLLTQLRPLGHNLLFTHKSSAVPLVDRLPKEPRAFGLIAAPRCIPKTIGASGKSFITVNAVKHGGAGATIAPFQNWQNKNGKCHHHPDSFLTRLTMFDGLMAQG